MVTCETCSFLASPTNTFHLAERPKRNPWNDQAEIDALKLGMQKHGHASQKWKLILQDPDLKYPKPNPNQTNKAWSAQPFTLSFHRTPISPLLRYHRSRFHGRTRTNLKDKWRAMLREDPGLASNVSQNRPGQDILSHSPTRPRLQPQLELKSGRRS